MCIVATYVDIHQFQVGLYGTISVGAASRDRPGTSMMYGVLFIVSFLFFVVCCHCVRECVIGVVSLSGVLWCCVCFVCVLLLWVL